MSHDSAFGFSGLGSMANPINHYSPFHTPGKNDKDELIEEGAKEMGWFEKFMIGALVLAGLWAIMIVLNTSVFPIQIGIGWFGVALVAWGAFLYIRRKK